MLKYSVFLLLFAVSNIMSAETDDCIKKSTTISYLNTAMLLITQAKNDVALYKNVEISHIRKPMDCADILHMGHNRSGTYTVWPVNRLTEGKSLNVYCDMHTDGGGWTLIQRRGDYSNPVDYFNREWKSYKEGFGDIEKEFWLGNDNIFALTNQKLYSGRFDMKDVEQERRYAVYKSFWIDDESSKYTLHFSDYTGNSGGDSMTSGRHNNAKFSTKDQDNDNSKDDSCAERHKGGWWFNVCLHVHMNGLYLKGKHESNADGVHWYHWKGYEESLESTEIKIRPQNFKNLHSDSISTPLR